MIHICFASWISLQVTASRSSEKPKISTNKSVQYFIVNSSKLQRKNNINLMKNTLLRKKRDYNLYPMYLFVYLFIKLSVSCSVVSDSETPWTVAHQAPLSTGFSRQEYCSGLLFPSPGDLSNWGLNLGLLHLLHWQADSLLTPHLGSLSRYKLLYKQQHNSNKTERFFCCC